VSEIRDDRYSVCKQGKENKYIEANDFLPFFLFFSIMKAGMKEILI